MNVTKTLLATPYCLVRKLRYYVYYATVPDNCDVYMTSLDKQILNIPYWIIYEFLTNRFKLQIISKKIISLRLKTKNYMQRAY